MPRRPGPARQLGVLPRRDRHARLAVELLELLEHHGSRRHVDSQREGLGREDELDQLEPEQLLDDLLERRQHPGVVGGDAALEALEPLPVAEHGQILVAQRAAAFVDDRADLVALALLGQAHAGPQHLAHGGVAARPGEDEEDRGKQVAGLEQRDDLRPVHSALAVPAVVREVASLVPRLFRGERPPAVVRHLLELGIHPVGRGEAGGVEQVEQPRAHEHVLLERHGSLLGDDHVGVAPHGLQPVAELLGVRHGRAERDEPHGLREVDDDLLPDGAAEPVGKVVHLVHDHVREVLEQARIGVEHVAENLGRHDHDSRGGVDVGVAVSRPTASGPYSPTSSWNFWLLRAFIGAV